MTGEGEFSLTDQERENLRQYVQGGGFLLASAGCSSREWDRSFRREMARIFPGDADAAPRASTIRSSTRSTRSTSSRPCTASRARSTASSLGGRLGVLYSQDGLNDTAHTHGCCCCGGNEITNSCADQCECAGVCIDLLSRGSLNGLPQAMQERSDDARSAVSGRPPLRRESLVPARLLCLAACVAAPPALGRPLIDPGKAGGAGDRQSRGAWP